MNKFDKNTQQEIDLINDKQSLLDYYDCFEWSPYGFPLDMEIRKLKADFENRTGHNFQKFAKIRQLTLREVMAIQSNQKR